MVTPTDSGGVGSRVNSRIASLKNDISEITLTTGTGFSKSEPQTFDNLPAAQQYVLTLEGDLSRRQESYIRRERGYRTRIEDLETEVRRLKTDRCSWGKDAEKMNRLKELHVKVLTNIENVKERTRSVLQEQERDLLRAFRARLFDVQSELEREKDRSNDGASVWIEKNRQLERDLEWARQMADRLERVNQALAKENTRLKSHFKTHEEDREFLIRQLVAVKKDNVRLKEDVGQLKEQAKAFVLSSKGSMSDLGARSSGGESSIQLANIHERENNARLICGRSIADASQHEQRYREIVRRLKRLLETERSNLRKVRKQYTEEIQQRTEVEHYLRLALQDVKREITVKRTSKFMFGPGSSSINSTAPESMLDNKEKLKNNGSKCTDDESDIDESKGGEGKKTETGGNNNNINNNTNLTIESKESGIALIVESSEQSKQRNAEDLGEQSKPIRKKNRKKQPTGKSKADMDVDTLPKSKDVFLEDFTPDLRERTLEILLSQERVVKLLYAKAFPAKPPLDAMPPSNRAPL